MSDIRGGNPPRAEVPLVSVIVTAYNQERFIAGALESLRAQTQPSWEAVVVDDGSTDGTWAEIERFAGSDGRVRPSRQANAGVSAARNRAFHRMHPDSEFVAILDGDDELEPHHLETLLPILRAAPALVAAYGPFRKVDPAGQSAQGGLPELDPPPGGTVDGPAMMARCWLYPPGGALFTKWAVLLAGPFDTHLRASEDWEWYIRLCALGDMAWQPRPVVRYRRHGNNVSDDAPLMCEMSEIVRRRRPFYEAAWRARAASVGAQRGASAAPAATEPATRRSPAPPSQAETAPTAAPVNGGDTPFRVDWSGRRLTRADLLQSMRALRSEDTATRRRAFATLRRVPREELVALWGEARAWEPAAGRQADCFARAEFEPPSVPIPGRRCVAVTVSPGYESYVDALVETFHRYGNSPEAAVVVFAIGDSYDALRARADLTAVRVTARERVNQWAKNLVLCAPRVAAADTFLCLEADMLVTGDLQPLWAALDAAPLESVLGTRAQRHPHQQTLGDILEALDAAPDSLSFLARGAAAGDPFAFNGGMLAGSRRAVLGLDGHLRGLAPFSCMWIEGGTAAPWSEEFVTMFAIDRLGMAREVAGAWNRQLYDARLDRWLGVRQDGRRVALAHEGEDAHILHFVGPSRPLFWEVKRLLDTRELVPAAQMAPDRPAAGGNRP